MATACLDSASSTPMLDEAIDAMVPFLRDVATNPSAAHGPGRAARRALEDAREQLAAVLGAPPGDVVLTSGGTEAANLAVAGVHDAAGGTVVCSAVEHPAVLAPTSARNGRTVGVDAGGVVELDLLAAALDPGVRVVSVMAVNNEVGTVQPVAAVASLVRELAPDAVFHVDAVQGLPWLDLRGIVALADLVSVSAHKFGGPKGVGALVVRDGVRLAPRLLGGGQERARRSGTQPVALAVAMAAAARRTDEQRAGVLGAVRVRRDRLVDTLVAELEGVQETVSRDDTVAGAAHVCVEGVESEALLFLLDEAGVAASAASACSSGASTSSHVLVAMGVPAARAQGALRLSLGHATTDAEIDHAAQVVVDAVRQLRRTGS